MNETDEAAERKKIRRLMRQRRRELAAADVDLSAERLRRRLLALPRFRHSRNIAAYLAVEQEISLAPLIETAWSLRIPVYLPCLRGKHMEFRRYLPDTPLRPNRFGIPEPEPTAGGDINRRFLDTVLAPLVAFDPRGGRLGTGGGYYDRTFAFLRHRHHWKRPLLLGVAYEFQQVPKLPLADWDVPLDAVITDRNTHLFQFR